jgi:hypothetical protein
MGNKQKGVEMEAPIIMSLDPVAMFMVGLLFVVVAGALWLLHYVSTVSLDFVSEEELKDLKNEVKKVGKKK